MLAHLPPEIWRIVFGYLTIQVPSINHSELSAEALRMNCTFPDSHSTRDFPTTAQFMDRAIPCRLWRPNAKPSAEALSVIQVCHAWHDLGLEFLYHTVVFRTKSHFEVLRVILAPPYNRGRFVRRVEIGRSVRVLPDVLTLVLDRCPNIEDFEADEIYPSRWLLSSLASQSSIRHCFFADRDPSYLYSVTPINLSLFINLQTLHIVAVTSIEQIPAVLPQLAVLVLKCAKGSSQYYQYVSRWTLPSLRVLVCQWIVTPHLHALCEAFAPTLELLEIIQYDSWSITPDTIEMPVLKCLVVDWTPPFSGYTPRFHMQQHFPSLPSLTTIRVENVDRALEGTSASAVAAEIGSEIAMLSSDSRFAPRLQTLYVGSELGGVAGGSPEECLATSAVVGWALQGRDGTWNGTDDGKLKLAELVSA
jgi:hypothetical protein